MTFFVVSLLGFIEMIVVVRVAFSWFMPSVPKAIAPVIMAIDRVLKPFRVVIPIGASAGVDIGPMLFLLLLEAISRFVISIAH